MKTTLIAMSVAATIGAGVSAQQQQPTTTPSGAPAAVDRGGNQTVHVTGCVARGETAAATSASAPQSPATFMLTSARMSNDSPTGTVAQTAEDTRNTAGAPQASAATSAPAATAGMRYMLKTSAADLTPHVGHQVEITGRFDSTVSYPHGVVVGTSGAANATPAPSASASQSAPPSVSTPPTLEVESVRMIAATCQK